MQSSVRSWRWEYWRWRWRVSILQDQPTEPQNFPVSPRGSEAGTAGPQPQSHRPVRRHMLALDQQQTAPSADRRGFFFLAIRCAREGRESRRVLLCTFSRPTSASRTKFRRVPRSSAASENGPGRSKARLPDFLPVARPYFAASEGGLGVAAPGVAPFGQASMGGRRFQTGGLPLLTGRKWLSSKGKLPFFVRISNARADATEQNIGRMQQATQVRSSD